MSGVSYKLVRVTEEPRRFGLLTRLFGPKVTETVVFVPSRVEVERQLNRPGRVLIEGRA